jgi:putative nucleotidyltransferase with HDIG domain
MIKSRSVVDECDDIRLRDISAVTYAVFIITDTRDPFTARHQRRVAELAQAIARELDLPRMSVMDVFIAGLLHDTGKLVVPAEILSKPTKLSEFEFRLIQSHAKAGFDILQKVGFSLPVTLAVLQHHERLNGSGYPDKLAAQDIIREAKILAIADVVEAMSSHRPYRPAPGLEAGLEEIFRNKGFLYDDDAVEACLSLFHNRESAFERLMLKSETPW